MKAWKMYGSGILTLAGFATGARAQDVPPPPPGAAVTTVAPAAPVQTIWMKLGISKDQLAVCKMKCCATPIGQLVNSMTKPLTAATGGLIPPHCPVVPPTKALQDAEKAKPGGVGAAAEMKELEAQAKERRAAIRYLGTVDCARFPKAKKALIAALEEDTNECVRWEAAMALGNGCCVDEDTIRALRVTIEGVKDPKSPAQLAPENSDRVRAAAWESLQHALSCYQEPVKEKKGEEPERLKPPEKSGESKPTTTVKVDAIPTALSKREQEQKALANEVALARKALEETPMNQQRYGAQPNSQRTVFNVVKNAVVGQPVGEQAVVAPMTTGPVVHEEHKIAPQPMPVQTLPAVPQPMKTIQSVPQPQKVVIQDSNLPVVKQPILGPQGSLSAPPSGLERTSLKSVTESNPMPMNTTTSKAPYQVEMKVAQPAKSMPVSTTVRSEGAVREQPRVNVGQMQRILADSAYPFQREWAARNLANSDPRQAGDIVPCLLSAARKDTATSVRVECIRGLVKMNANSSLVRTTLQTLKADYDPMVRLEASRALSQLEVGLTAAR